MNCLSGAPIDPNLGEGWRRQVMECTVAMRHGQLDYPLGHWGTVALLVLWMVLICWDCWKYRNEPWE